MKKFSVICVIAGFAFAKALSAQTGITSSKEEKEVRIEEQQFPTKALSVVKEIAGDHSIKYYSETDGERRSYEAKFTHEKRRYSLECDPEGAIVELEIELKKKNLPSQVLSRIEHQCSQYAQQFKMHKIQEHFQYKYPDKRGMAKYVHTNYEVIIAFKSKGKISYEEWFLDLNGSLIERKSVTRQSYDFLLF